VTYIANDRNGREIKTVSLAVHISTVAIICSISIGVISMMVGKAWGRAEILDSIVTRQEFDIYKQAQGQHFLSKWHHGAGEAINGLSVRVNRNEQDIDSLMNEHRKTMRGLDKQGGDR